MITRFITATLQSSVTDHVQRRGRRGGFTANLCGHLAFTSLEPKFTNSGLEEVLPVTGTLRMPMTTYQETYASDSLPLDLSDAFPVDICGPGSGGRSRELNTTQQQPQAEPRLGTAV